MMKPENKPVPADTPLCFRIVDTYPKEENAMKRTLLLLLTVLFLAALIPSSFAEDPILAFGPGEPDILGKPFPDFTVDDTTRTPFSLSGALQNHDAVLINIFASWCGSCLDELPLLNETYKKYGDRVAFIGLDFEPEDTILDVAHIHIGYKVPFPMSRTVGTGLNEYLGAFSVPCTLVVDRFGTLCFKHTNLFENEEELSRVLDVFVQDNYTESRILNSIPLDSATRAYPVSGDLEIRVDNENARPVILRASDGYTETDWIIPDDTAHLRFSLPAEYQPSDMVVDYVIGNDVTRRALSSLVNPEQNAYVLDLPMSPLPGELPCIQVSLSSRAIDRDIRISSILFPGEEALVSLVDLYRKDDPGLTWEYADNQPEKAAAPAETYLLHMIDQYGSPVPGVMVNFCTDKSCTALTADENGLVAFAAPVENYHIQLLKAPAGYSFDPDFELNTGTAAGEWSLLVRKD